MDDLTFLAPEHARLAYAVLARLDLGRDAANLYDPTLPKRPWTPTLQARWRPAVGRLELHFAPLRVDDLPALLQWLAPPGPRALQDAPGQALAQAFALALGEEAAQTPEGGVGPADPAQTRHQGETADLLARARAVVGPDLTVLRRALWSRVGRPPPPLQVWHVRALRGHGRALGRPGERVCATDLSASPAAVLCQLLHEECHPVSDPGVMAGSGGASVAGGRDTRVGAAGYDQHLALERGAVELGAEVVAETLPRLAPGYARWRVRFGL